MKRFTFSLRPVAVLRAHREMRAQEAFAVAVRVQVDAEEKLSLIRARVVELGSILFEGRLDRFRPADTAAFFRAYSHECASEIVAERKVQAARAETAARRQDYLKAHRDVKVVSILEDKARAAYRLEAARVEQAELDEIATFQSPRQPVLT